MAAFCVEVADRAGVCYGVERALCMARDAGLAATGRVHTLGPLIHNPIVVQDLAASGVEVADTLDDVESGTVIVRAHGVVPEIVREACDRGLEVLDATCPYVKKVHRAAERLVSEGYRLIIVGEPGHPEVEGILGHAGPGAVVVSDPSELPTLEIGGKVGVVVQTTQTAEALSAVVAALAARTGELRVINTICAATQERQDSAAKLASRVDAMVVVGGKNSGNTRRLAEICRERCPETFHIEDAAELESSWFVRARVVGLTAGASTPPEHIDRAVEALRAIGEELEA